MQKQTPPTSTELAAHAVEQRPPLQRPLMQSLACAGQGCPTLVLHAPTPDAPTTNVWPAGQTHLLELRSHNIAAGQSQELLPVMVLKDPPSHAMQGATPVPRGA